MLQSLLYQERFVVVVDEAHYRFAMVVDEAHYRFAMVVDEAHYRFAMVVDKAYYVEKWIKILHNPHGIMIFLNYY